MSRSLCAALLLVASVLPARAQTVQVWPEVDVFVRLNAKARLLLVATTVRESDQVTDGEFGPSLDVHLKPIRRTPQLLFRLDESKNQVLTIRSGYRYMPSFTAIQRSIAVSSRPLPGIRCRGTSVMC